MVRTKRNVTKAEKPSSASLLSAAELAYARSQQAVCDIGAQEDQRRLRVQIQTLRDEMNTVNEHVTAEAERADAETAKSERYQVKLEETTSEVGRLQQELQTRMRDCESLRAQLQASQNSSTEASNLLSENLSLKRETANMRPELEHLRSQASSNSNLLSEKLSLQQQLKDVQAELEDNRRYLARMEKQDEKRSRKSEEYSKQVEELKQELSDSRKLLAESEKERAKIEGDKTTAAESANAEELDSLREELSNERKERQKLERSQAKEVQHWETERAVFEDKLSQFRTKLRSTKERLRDTEAELETQRSEAAAASAEVAKAKASSTKSQTSKPKNPRKRTAAQSVDQDTAIGTPGDGDANKRSKRASSVVGEKSTFSITPFLNRTASVQPEGADEPIASIEDRSPSVRPSTTTANGKAILGPAGVGKSNPKTKPKRSIASEPTLEKVAEEAESNDENADPTGTIPVIAEKQKQSDNKAPKPILKPRKSLAHFTSFREGSLQPESRMGSMPPAQKKRRKLLGSAGAKTLFDDDEEGDTAGGATAGGKTLFNGGNQRAFGTFGKAASGPGGGLSNKRKGPLQTADGFAFSPLKKERRAMAAANRAASEVSDA